LETVQCYWDEFFAASVTLANSTLEKFIPLAGCYKSIHPYLRLSLIVNRTSLIRLPNLFLVLLGQFYDLF